MEDIRTFGYTYPELSDWALAPDDLAASARAAVNSLYGQDESAVSDSTRRRWQQKAKRDIISSTDFSVELSVDRAQLPLPCSIELQLVDSDDSGSSNTSGTNLGGAVLLTMPSKGTSYTLVPLRRVLLAEARGPIPPSFVDAADVVAQLHQRLRIVIQSVRSSTASIFLFFLFVPPLTILQHDGTTIPVDSVSSLRIEIQQRSFELATASNVFPQYGPIIRWPLVPGLLV